MNENTWGESWGISWGGSWDELPPPPRIEDDYVNFVSEFEYVDFDGMG
jgi:hypothetical protein